jgi:hypothetical protein
MAPTFNINHFEVHHGCQTCKRLTFGRVRSSPESVQCKKFNPPTTNVSFVIESQTQSRRKAIRVGDHGPGLAELESRYTKCRRGDDECECKILHSSSVAPVLVPNLMMRSLRRKSYTFVHAMRPWFYGICAGGVPRLPDAAADARKVSVTLVRW